MGGIGFRSVRRVFVFVLVAGGVLVGAYAIFVFGFFFYLKSMGGLIRGKLLASTRRLGSRKARAVSACGWSTIFCAAGG